MELKKSLVYSGKMPSLLCCDTIVRRMPNGDLLTLFLSGGPYEPHPDNHVLCSRSEDGGRTWGRPRRLFSEHGLPALIPTEVSVFGEKATVYLTAHDGNFLKWKKLVAESFDSGHTWSEPRQFAEVPDFSAIRTLLVLKNGDHILPWQRISVPLEEREMLMAEKKKLFNTHRATFENGALISKDSGKTWACGKSVTLPEKFKIPRSDGYDFIWTENNIAELSDGTLAMLIRADRTSRLLRCDSTDGGMTWGEIYATDIPNPGTKPRLFNLSEGKIGLLNCPAPCTGPWFFDRNPIAFWISDDDMKTWDIKYEIEDFPGALSYADGFFDEKTGELHFAFDYNRHDVIYERVKF